MYLIEIYDYSILRAKEKSRNESLNIACQVEVTKLSRGMRFPTIWYVRPSKAQTSLRIRAD